MIARTRGVICEPEQIVIGPGTQTLIHRLMDMKSKEATIAIEDPGYARFYTLLKRMGFTVQPIQLDHKGIDIRSEEHTSELQSRFDIVCRLLLEKKKTKN